MQRNRKVGVRERRFALKFFGVFCPLVLLLAVLLGPWKVVRAQALPPRITGTYSDMQYVSEAGDVVGYELKIVFTGSRFQGALQIAEGVPGPLMIVDIVQNGTSISFTIPSDSPYAGKFAGKIANGWLKGVFVFNSGGREAVSLPRGKSYWD